MVVSPQTMTASTQAGPGETPMLQAYRLFCGAARRDGQNFKMASKLWKSSSIRAVFVEEVSPAERKKRRYE